MGLERVGVGVGREVSVGVAAGFGVAEAQKQRRELRTCCGRAGPTLDSPAIVSHRHVR